MTTDSDNSDNPDDTFARLESMSGNYGMGAFVQQDPAGQQSVPRPDASAATMNLGVPTDPDLNGSANSQWYLIGTWGIHADKVWPDYTGTGILLADLDDGFQTNHPDLAANLNTALSYNFVTNTGNVNPMDSTDNHGTAVMGVMVADDNGIGTVGVAFDAQGVGIVQGFGSSGLDQTLSGFRYALTAGVDVMNNSWGYSDPYADDFGKTFSGTSFSQVGAAMKALVDQGRDGLGTDIVFSAGNSRADGDNTNYHNFQNSPYVITVAAIDSTGHVASFSTPGTSILVSAGGVNDLTTDRTGAAGYVSGDYGLDSGTSFSAPTVSGLIGLMLQANPDLGWRDVQEILAYSAQHNDPASAGWHYNGAGNWNGGGLHYSSDYGFGAADAFTAVRLAESWNTQQTSANMTTFSTATAAPHVAIPDLGMATSTINVTQNIDIEHVLINLNISHSFAGDLVVTLIAPDGTQSVLVNNPGNDSFTGIYGVTGIQFQASTVADWGESSAGAWTLKVQDNVRGDSGTLNSWSLTFMGSTPGTDDTYIYTNEFGGFSGTALTVRNTLTDTNGGNDTINLAAVTSNTTLNMTDGTTSTVAGNALHIAAGTVIENAWLGDGNDTVTGNAADNHISAGRGNDLVIGSAGNDVLDGGTGTDTVSYLETIADFAFTFVSATVVDIAHAVGAAWTDAVSNFEDFAFSEGTYTLADIETYAGGGSLPPPPPPPPPPSGIYGTAGDDVISGTTGADTMIGGTGNDTYVVNNAGDVIIENPGEGADLVQASITYTLADNAENLTLTGTAAINGTGNALDNVLAGNAANNVLTGGDGNDVLNGGAGADIMIGGGGNDTYFVDNRSDIVTENPNEGADLAMAAISYTLGANVENLTLTGAAAINGTGNALDNVITGNAAANVLDGGAGADTMSGGAGNDTYIVDNSGDTIIEGLNAGIDTVKSSISHALAANVENLTLTGTGAINGAGNDLVNVITGNAAANVLSGGAGNDTLSGGTGNDTLYGGTENDILTGGSGADRFVFEAATAANGLDTIKDFSATAGDKLDLSLLLSGSHPAQAAIDHFIHATRVSTGTMISVDVTGSGITSHFVNVALLQGVSGINIDTLFKNGNIVD